MTTLPHVELAQIYVDSITAPQKHVVLIADAGHDAIITKSGEFLELLVQRVRPLAFQPEATTGTTRPASPCSVNASTQAQNVSRDSEWATMPKSYRAKRLPRSARSMSRGFWGS